MQKLRDLKQISEKEGRIGGRENWRMGGWEERRMGGREFRIFLNKDFLANGFSSGLLRFVTTI